MNRVGGAIVFCAAFVIAHTQSPLYYSNQNQYFLHGFARAGVGDLANDWLANTRDPTPVFSELVAIWVRLMSPFSFQVIYALMLAGYAAAAAWLMRGVSRGLGLFAAWMLFLAIHGAVFRVASARLFGVDYPWYLQAGVANQYLLGPGLQPSSFGVLLLVSLAAFAANRVYGAALWAAGAAVMHSTYLLASALLVLGFAVALWREGRRREGLNVVLLALAVVMPTLVYAIRYFAPTDMNTFAAAQDILVNVRLPQHARIVRRHQHELGKGARRIRIIPDFSLRLGLFDGAIDIGGSSHRALACRNLVFAFLLQLQPC
jgi:hypothetical protein